MPPVVFINCDRQPFIDQILAIEKTLETRTRNTLKSVCGQYVFLAETHRGKKPIVRAATFLGDAHKITTKAQWDSLREYTCIREGSEYDWKHDTKVKHVYSLAGTHPVEPFTPPEGRRHGRVWMDYEEGGATA